MCHVSVLGGTTIVAMNACSLFGGGGDDGTGKDAAVETGGPRGTLPAALGWFEATEGALSPHAPVDFAGHRFG